MMDRLEWWNMPQDRVWDKKTGAEIRNPAPNKIVLYVPWLPLFYSEIKELDLKVEAKTPGFRMFSTYMNPSGKVVGFAYIVPDDYSLLKQATRII